MLFVITVFYNLHNKIENKLNSWENIKKLSKEITFSRVFKIIIYFILIICVGVLINFFSSWIGNRLTNPWELQTINYALIVCTVFFLILHFIIKEESWNYKYNLILISIALMFVVFDLLNKNNLDSYLVIYKYLSFIFVTFYSIYLFYQILRVLVKPYNSINEDKKFPHKQHLIVFLSSISKDDLKKWEMLPKIIDFKVKSLKQIIDFIQKDFNKLPWAMTLISIEHHLKGTSKNGKLKQLSIIASSNEPSWSIKNKLSSPSMEQVNDFIEILKKYLEYNNLKLVIKIAKKVDETLILTNETDMKNNNCYKRIYGINFGSVEETNEAMRQILENKINKIYSHKETVIDITGGQKSSTVAGILAATSLDVCNQYVDTNDTTKVKGYNFLYRDPTSAG
jgi:hypothetical protein